MFAALEPIRGMCTLAGWNSYGRSVQRRSQTRDVFSRTRLAGNVQGASVVMQWHSKVSGRRSGVKPAMLGFTFVMCSPYAARLRRGS